MGKIIATIRADYRRDSLLHKLWVVVLPIALQNFMLAFVSATDAIMLGFVDQTSLSAVSLAGQIQFVLNLFVTGIAIGCGIMIAQYWGKNDLRAIEKVMPVALYTNVLFSGIFTLLALFVPDMLMKIFTNDPALIASGVLYIRAVAFSYILCGISQIYLALLKNTGRVALCSKISSAAVVINIVLNGVLIFGLLGFPKLGIVGAAYATAAARAIELIWAYLAVKRGDSAHIYWRGILHTQRQLTRDFWRYSLPALGAALVWGIAYVSYTVVLGHLGSDTVAANSIANIVKSMISCLVRGVSAGAGIIIGNMLGANELEKAKKSGGRITRISIMIGVVTGLFLMGISPFVVRLSPISAVAKSYLQFMMIIVGFNLMAQSVNTVVFDGIFCAGGDSAFDMVGNVGAMWCFGVPLGFLSAFVFHAPVWVVYIIVNLDEIVKMPAMYIHYMKYKWVRNITRES